MPISLLNRIRIFNKNICLVISAIILFACKPAYGQIPILKGDSLKADESHKEGRFFPSPLLGYTPETRLYFGAGLVWYLPPSKKYPGTNPSVLKAVGVYTLNKQIESNITGESWLRNNKYKLNYSTSYYKFPDSFFGVGNNTQTNEREFYGFDFFNFLANAQQLTGPHIYSGLRLFIENTKMYDIEPGGLFDSLEFVGENGGWNNGIGPWFTLDTRDNIYYPLKGFMIDISAVPHGSFLGSAYNYTHIELEYSQFFRIQKNDAFAFNIYAEGVPGNVPFNRMAELGGENKMRGHFEGKYRDKYYLTAQAEYRVTIWKYFAVHLFGGLGEVASTIDAFSLPGLKYSYGIGGRLFIVPEDKVSIRMDYGFNGEGGGGLYITFREAF